MIEMNNYKYSKKKKKNSSRSNPISKDVTKRSFPSSLHISLHDPFKVKLYSD